MYLPASVSRLVSFLVLFLIVIGLPILFLSPSHLPTADAESNATSNLSLRLVPTYESVGIYLDFAGDGDGDNNATLEYRRAGAVSWLKGMDLSPDRRPTINGQANPYENQWRGSLVGLQPNTSYDVRVTVKDPDGSPSPVVGSVKTRTDQIPSNGRSLYVSPTGSASAPCQDGATFGNIQSAADCAEAGDTVYVKAGTYKGNVVIRNGGEPNNLLTIRSYQNDRVIVIPDNAVNCGGAWDSCGFHVANSYVRLKGFEVRGGDVGIAIGPEKTLDDSGSPKSPQPEGVIVEDNTVRDGKTLSSAPGKYYGFLVGGKSANYLNYVRNITIQRNTIYVVEPGATDKNLTSGEAIKLVRVNGGHVIRGNKIYFSGTTDVHGRDCINSMPNFTFENTIQDTDIYDNYCEGATDDAISLDGNAANVRVWGNTILRANNGLSITPAYIGPVHVFRNVFREPERHWTSHCRWIKGGESSSGYVYFYHNTILYNDRVAEGDGKDCPSTFGFSLGQGQGGEASNVVSRNNIIATDGPLTSNDTPWPDMDYDLLFNSMKNTDRRYWARWSKEAIGDSSQTNAQNFAEFQATACGPTGCQEQHGHAGFPIFVDLASGNLQLDSGSHGIDQGVVLYGFNDANSRWAFKGSAPEIGAVESGGPSVALPPEPSTSPDPAPSPDVEETAPVISGLDEKKVAETSATIAWSTDQPSNAKVAYGVSSSSLDGSASRSSLSLSHELTLSGLSASAKYYYKATSCNEGGLCTTSSTQSFTTTASAADEPSSPSDVHVEVESMSLTDYVVDKSHNADWVKIRSTKQTASAAMTFKGATGSYNIDIVAVAENDGQSKLEVWIDGVRIKTFTYPKVSVQFQPVTFTLSGVSLASGDKVRLVGRRDTTNGKGTWARLDELAFNQVSGASAPKVMAEPTLEATPTPSPTPTPEPTATPTPEPTATPQPKPAVTLSSVTMEAESMRMNGYKVDKGQNTEWIRIVNHKSVGTAFKNFPGEHGTYDVAIKAIAEFDGQSTLEVWIGGKLKKTFTYPLVSAEFAPTTFHLSGIAIAPGDEIRFVGHTDPTGDGGTWARLDKVVFTPVS